MADYGMWGEPVQGGLAYEGSDRGPGTRAFPELALVLKVYPRDHDLNVGRACPECDVIILRTMTPLSRVPVSQPTYGSDGQEWLPRANSTKLNLVAGGNPFQDSDGDFVIIDFLGGVSPIIRGQAPRPRTGNAPELDYSATVADGRRLKGKINKTTWEVDKDGRLRVHVYAGKFAGMDGFTKIEITGDGNVLVELPGTDGQTSPVIQLGKDGLSALVGDGVVLGSGIDSFTGATYFALGSASIRVLARKA